MASMITPMGYRRPLTELSVKVLPHSLLPHLYSCTTSCFFWRVPRRTKYMLWQKGQAILVFCSTLTTGTVSEFIPATSALGRPSIGYSFFVFNFFMLENHMRTSLARKYKASFFC